MYLTETELSSWGWRIPFAIGAAGALPVLWLRLSMDESNQFQHMSTSQRQSAGTIRALLKYPKQILTVVGLTLGGTICFYTYTTYMQKFMINSVGLPKGTVALINFAAPLHLHVPSTFGGLHIRSHRPTPLLFFFGIGSTVLTVPLFWLMQNTKTPLMAFLLMLVGLILVTGYTSINAIVKAELFPTEIRALGVGFPYGLTVALFGGTTEYIALWFKQAHHEKLLLHLCFAMCAY